MRVLVLGATGRIGKMLQVVWQDEASVTPTWHGRNASDITFDIMDDTDALRSAIGANDVVLNLAGATHHGDDLTDGPNQALARQILEHAQDTPVLLISSAAIYGPQNGHLSEATKPQPVSDYGHDKLAMERVAADHPNAKVLRLGNVVGADALLGTPRSVYTVDRFANGLTPRRSYIAPQQLGMVFVKLINHIDKIPAIVNIATPEPVAMGDLLDAAGKNWQPRPAPPDAIAEVTLDTSSLEKLVKFAPDASQAGVLVKDWQQVSNTL